MGRTTQALLIRPVTHAGETRNTHQAGGLFARPATCCDWISRVSGGRQDRWEGASGFRQDRGVRASTWRVMGIASFAPSKGQHMPDVLVLLGTLVSFAALLGLLKGVERL